MQRCVCIASMYHNAGKEMMCLVLLSSYFFLYANALMIVNNNVNVHQNWLTYQASATSCSSAKINVVDEELTYTCATFHEEYIIREAVYADLPYAALLITDGFHPELNNNPIARPFRVMLELDRLQNNFPYQDDRHSYLVCEMKEEKKVVGFCDVDGRIPMKKKENPFSPFASIVNRPHPYFSDLTVNSDYRRKGIASALVGEGERRAKDIMKCQEMYLGVSSANTAALSLYSNMGYEIIVPTGDILEFVKRQEGVRMLRRTLD